jgi:hypothetical protein
MGTEAWLTVGVVVTTLVYCWVGRQIVANPVWALSRLLSITVAIFYWRICLMSESIDHHDSEIMDDRSLD